MSKLLRKMDTPENRRYWKHVEKVAKEVARWPKWKREWAKNFLKIETY